MYGTYSFFLPSNRKKNWLGKKTQQLVTKSCICVILLLAVVLQLGANQGSRVTVTLRPYLRWQDYFPEKVASVDEARMERLQAEPSVRAMHSQFRY